MNIRERLNEIRAHLEAIERELKPDAPIAPWHEAPEWAMWIATDFDGMRFWFQSEPFSSEVRWRNAGGQSRYAGHQNGCANWLQSKQRRPE
jgi:hypothetical protein